MRKFIVPLVLASALALAACGSSSHKASSSPTPASSASTVHFAKTKFALHAGLAFGAFHRWIYKPFRADELQHPLTHKLAFTKALLAGAFVLHEVRLARADAAHSRILSHVVLPLTAVAGSMALIHAALVHHRVDSSAITSANSSIADAHSASSAAGQPITETTAGAPI